jgi:hypothetical protein
MPLYMDSGFYDLEWLSVRWGLPQENILFQALEEHLELSIHVEDVILFRGQKIQLEHGYQKTGIVNHHYGILPLHELDVEKIVMKGSVETRRFRPRPSEDFCELENGQPSQVVEIKDLIVEWGTAHQYERSHQINVQELHEKPSLINPQIEYDLVVDSGYKVVSLGPSQWDLGPLQAAVVRRLHEAAIVNRPWLFGKQLLASCGSESTHIGDLFKRKKGWQKLILSDERGLYRLNCAAHLWRRDMTGS